MRGRGVGHVAGDAALGVAREEERQIDRRAPLQIAEIHARLAQPLHRHEAHHRARPLVAGGAAAGAAEAVAEPAGGEIGALGAPLPRQRAHRARRHAGLALLPFGRLGDAVVVAEDVALPLLEAVRARRDEVLVVQALVDPDMGDGERQRGVGAGARRDPVAAQEGRGVVEIGIDVDDRDAELLQPLAPDRAFVAAVDAAGRFRIARPEHHHLGIAAADPRPCRSLRRGRCAWCSPSGAPRPSTSLPNCRGCWRWWCGRRDWRSAAAR